MKDVRETWGIVQLVALISMPSNGRRWYTFLGGRGGSIAADRVGGHDIRLAHKVGEIRSGS